MPILLDINPNQNSKNDYVSFADIFLPGDFLVTCRCELYNHLSQAGGMLFSGGNSGGGVEIYRSGSLGIQLYINGANVGEAGNLWPYYDGITDNPRDIILRRVGTTLTVEIGGSAIITVTNSATLKINRLAARGASFNLGFRFYSLEAIAGAFYRKYDANLSGGSGTVLPTNDGVNQGTLNNFPLDNSQWVVYESGEDPEPVNQNYESGGTTGRTVTPITVTEFVNDQSASSSGSTGRSVLLAAASDFVNGQEFETSGSVSTTRPLFSESEFLNEQAFISSGVVAVQRNAHAGTEFVDEQSNVQEHESGGSTGRYISASAITSFINQQEFLSAGYASIAKSVMATTEFQDSYSNDQQHASGGSTGRISTIEAFTSYANEQQFTSGGVVTFTVRVYAETEFFDDGYTPQFTANGLSATVVKQNISAQVIRPGYSATIIQ